MRWWPQGGSRNKTIETIGENDSLVRCARWYQVFQAKEPKLFFFFKYTDDEKGGLDDNDNVLSRRLVKQRTTLIFFFFFYTDMETQKSNTYIYAGKASGKGVHLGTHFLF